MKNYMVENIKDGNWKRLKKYNDKTESHSRMKEKKFFSSIEETKI